RLLAVPAGAVNVSTGVCGGCKGGSGCVLQKEMVLVLSSTAANWGWPLTVFSPSPKAPPLAGSMENWPTNWPGVLNSASSLGWLGSAFWASLLAAIRLPLAAKISPSGPCRCVGSLYTTAPVPPSVVAVVALTILKTLLSAEEAT